jgi:hypothetical protein
MAPIHALSRQARLEAYQAAWTAIRRSTEPADRPRAERAILALYRERGVPAPEILWVPSPAAGVLAWHVASRAAAPVRNLYTRGETGSGANRAFRALDDPFGLEPAWAERALRRAREMMPSAIATVPAVWPRASRHRFELPEVHVRAAVERAILRAHGAAQATISADGRIRVTEEALARPAHLAHPSGGLALARQVVGDSWEALAAIVGPARLEQVALDGLARAVDGLLDVRATLGHALAAMDMPQHRDELLGMGLHTHVLGIPLWRPRVQREERALAVEHRLDVAHSVGAWWALEGLAICSERPRTLRLDDQGRPHASDGPAIAYPDGFEVFADHGVVLPGWLVTSPTDLTLEAIDAEPNAEVRRVMVERYGADRLVREGGAELISEDDVGRLWRRFRAGDEPIAMVEVRNATAEPDGTYRTYYLRVPPWTWSARGGVAWTFGLEETRYAPVQET